MAVHEWVKMLYFIAMVNLIADPILSHYKWVIYIYMNIGNPDHIQPVPAPAITEGHCRSTWWGGSLCPFACGGTPREPQKMQFSSKHEEILYDWIRA